jgi:hypothetical protein
MAANWPLTPSQGWGVEFVSSGNLIGVPVRVDKDTKAALDLPLGGLDFFLRTPEGPAEARRPKLSLQFDLIDVPVMTGEVMISP